MTAIITLYGIDRAAMCGREDRNSPNKWGQSWFSCEAALDAVKVTADTEQVLAIKGREASHESDHAGVNPPLHRCKDYLRHICGGGLSQSTGAPWYA
jgi:hypothetical protein